jgi:hypothetical protein
MMMERKPLVYGLRRRTPFLKQNVYFAACSTAIPKIYGNISVRQPYLARLSGAILRANSRE